MTDTSMAARTAKKVVAELAKEAPKPYFLGFPPYQNLEVPKGCVKQQCVYSVEWQAGGQTYIVQFTYEIVFGTRRSFQKKTESMHKKVRALLQLSTLNDIHYTPGFTVELKKNYGQTEKG